MCLAIPMKLIHIENASPTKKTGTVELDGVQRSTDLTLVPHSKIGDHLIVHAGFAIAIMNEEEAQRSLEIYRDMTENMEQEK